MNINEAKIAPPPDRRGNHRERRLMRGVTTVDMSAGYARVVEPFFVIEQYVMHGEEFNTPYCPVIFR